MIQSFENKVEELLEIFLPLTTQEERYKKIIELGRKLAPFPQDKLTEEHLVSGCQSKMYLVCQILENNTLLIQARSDALISAGLAYLLLFVYSGQTPQTILTSPPHFIEKLSILPSITPGRANGLASLYVTIKKEALKQLSMIA